MLIIHHDDLDGRCAAALVLHLTAGKDKRLCEMNYNMEFPFDEIGEGEVVYIVDMDLGRSEVWSKLLSITRDVIWIDHHKTSIEHKGVAQTLCGIRSSDHSAAGLVWKYFRQREQMPKVVAMISDYDNWTHQIPESKLLVHGMMAEDHDPMSNNWTEWFEGNGIDQIIRNGHVIRAADARKNADYINKFGFESEFEGCTCYCCNKGVSGSELFHSLSKDYDILISFGFDGLRWTVSLYSTNVDVSLIAQKFGGGGHKNAAGFQCATLPFRRKK